MQGAAKEVVEAGFRSERVLVQEETGLADLSRQNVCRSGRRRGKGRGRGGLGLSGLGGVWNRDGGGFGGSRV